MAIVTGFTAERMLEIEQSTVVSGHVDGGRLILVTREGLSIDAGAVGGTGGGGSSSASDLISGTVPDGRFPERLKAYHNAQVIYDLNTATESGSYYFNGTSNGPNGVGDCHIVVSSYSSQYVTQVAYPLHSDRSFLRRRDNGTWTAWVEMASKTDLPNLSFGNLSGQIHDDQLVDRLTTAGSTTGDWDQAVQNGYYKSYADNTNGPYNATWMGHVYTFDGGQVTQTVTQLHVSGRLDGSDSATYTRTRQNGVWGTWHKTAYTYEMLTAGFASLNHSHDARYYTKTIADGLFALPSRLKTDPVFVNDANLANESGFYGIDINASNRPPANDYYHLIVQRLNGAWIYQEATSISGSSFASNRYSRKFLNGSWSTWEKLLETSGSIGLEFAPMNHTHDNRYYTNDQVDSKLTGYAPLSHSQPFSTITGVLDDGQLPPQLRRFNQYASDLNAGVALEGGFWSTTGDTLNQPVAGLYATGWTQVYNQDVRYRHQYLYDVNSDMGWERRQNNSVWGPWFKRVLDSDSRLSDARVPVLHSHSTFDLLGRIRDENMPLRFVGDGAEIISDADNARLTGWYRMEPWTAHNPTGNFATLLVERYDANYHTQTAEHISAASIDQARWRRKWVGSYWTDWEKVLDTQPILDERYALPSRLKTDPTFVNDPNLATESGFYGLNIYASNGPDVADYFHLFVQRLSAAWIYQEATSVSGSGNASNRFSRKYLNGTWSAWEKILDTTGATGLQFAPINHNHDDRYYTEDEIEYKFNQRLSSYAPLSHRHVFTEIDGGLDDTQLPYQLRRFNQYVGDLNAVPATEGGFWSTNAATLNQPVANLYAFGWTVAYNLDQRYMHQFLYDVNSTAAWQRQKIGTSWTPWTPIAGAAFDFGANGRRRDNVAAISLTGAFSGSLVIDLPGIYINSGAPDLMQQFRIHGYLYSDNQTDFDLTVSAYSYAAVSTAEAIDKGTQPVKQVQWAHNAAGQMAIIVTLPDGHQWRWPNLVVDLIQGHIKSREVDLSTVTATIKTDLSGYTSDRTLGVRKWVFDNDIRLTDARTPLAHSQPFSTITGTIADTQLPDRLMTQNVTGDLNNITASGFYVAGPSTDHRPVVANPGGDYWVVTYSAFTPSDGLQTATLYFNNGRLDADAQVWRRIRQGGGWSNWERLFTNENELNSKYFAKDGGGGLYITGQPNFAGGMRLRDGNHGLEYVTYGVAGDLVDGPRLFGYGGGELGRMVDGTFSSILRWDANGVRVLGQQVHIGRGQVVSGDFNTFTKPGSYQIENLALGPFTNAPPMEGAAWGSLHVDNSDGNVISQTYMPLATGQSAWYRVCWYGNWTVWNRLLGQADLDLKANSIHTHPFNQVTGVIANSQLPGRITETPLRLDDMNGAIYNGWYATPPAGSGVANRPSASLGVDWLLSQYVGDSANGKQRAWNLSGNNNDSKEYYRKRVNGAWQAWDVALVTRTEMDARYTTRTSFNNRVGSIADSAYLTGGGTITANNGRIKWTTRFIPMATREGSYYDIPMPAVGTTIYGLGTIPNQTVDADGIYLPGWWTLFYKRDTGQYMVGTYNQGTWAIDDYMVFIATASGDDSSIRLCTGITIQRQSYTYATNPYPIYTKLDEAHDWIGRQQGRFDIEGQSDWSASGLATANAIGDQRVAFHKPGQYANYLQWSNNNGRFEFKNQNGDGFQDLVVKELHASSGNLSYLNQYYLFLAGIIQNAALPKRLRADGYGDVPGNDWNNVTDTGFYSALNAANMPPGTGGWGIVIHHQLAGNTDYGEQIFRSSAIGQGQAPLPLWRRLRDNGTWGPWIKNVQDNDSRLSDARTPIGHLHSTFDLLGRVRDENLPTRLIGDSGEYLNDADTARQPGWYKLTPSSAHNPTGTYANLYVERYDGNYQTQTADNIYAVSIDPARWRRKWQNTYWTDWELIVDTEAGFSVKYATLNHNHDDRYYTESEIEYKLTQRLTSYAPVQHRHVFTDIDGGIDSNQLPYRLRDSAQNITDGDWNNADQNGWWMGYNVANSPQGRTEWWIGEVVVHNTGWLIQTIRPFTSGGAPSGSPEYWYRVKHNGGWNSWYRTNFSQLEMDNRYLAAGVRYLSIGQYFNPWEWIDLPRSGALQQPCDMKITNVSTGAEVDMEIRWVAIGGGYKPQYRCGIAFPADTYRVSYIMKEG